MAEAEKRTDTGLAGQLSRVWRLSVPAILTQITSIVMQYIDSAMVGRSMGAGEYKLAKRYANIATAFGAALMALTGVVMWLACPLVFQMLTPSKEVQALAAEVLRIELLAEPLFAVSISFLVIDPAAGTLPPSPAAWRPVRTTLRWRLRSPLPWLRLSEQRWKSARYPW